MGRERRWTIDAGPGYTGNGRTRRGCRAVGFKDPAGRRLLLVIICPGKTSNITATGQRRFWVEFLGRNYLVEVT